MRYEVGINIVCDQLKIKFLNNQFGRYQKLNTNTVEHHSYNFIFDGSVLCRYFENLMELDKTGRYLYDYLCSNLTVAKTDR